MTVRAQLVAPAPTVHRPDEPSRPTATSAPSTSPSAVAVIGTLPGTRPVPARRPRGGLLRGLRSGGPSLLGGLLGKLLALLHLGRTGVGRLIAQDKRLLAYVGAALVLALGGQIAPAADPIGVPTVLSGDVTTAAQVLDLAGAEIGTTESRGGGTPYHDAYGLPDDQPWCAIFVWDVFQGVGGTGSIGPKTAYTPTMAGWFQAHGRWSATPEVGALVFYDWPGDSKRRIQHVGIVESFTPTAITTIEGNTSPGFRGSQDNGDGVYRRERLRTDAAGYGLPIFGLPQRGAV
jgi:hypothetical protein